VTAPLLPGIWQRLERAQLNFVRLHTEFTEHFAQPENQCCLVPEIVNSNEGIVKAEIRVKIPDWQLLVSDIVCDMRFVLDNLAYELVVANTGVDPPPNANRIEFPIFADRDEFMRTGRNGRPARGGGLAKMGGMNPWVQRLIEAIQPYNDIANGTLPHNQALLALNEMCNIYKHRLLVPILIKLETIQIGFQPEDCTISDIVPAQNVHEIENGSVVATFRIKPLSDKANVEISTQPFTGLGFPSGVFAEFHNIIDFGAKELHIVRTIIAALTEIQWGTPIDLPKTAPYFLTPLGVTVPNLYGP